MHDSARRSVLIEPTKVCKIRNSFRDMNCKELLRDDQPFKCHLGIVGMCFLPVYRAGWRLFYGRSHPTPRGCSGQNFTAERFGSEHVWRDRWWAVRTARSSPNRLGTKTGIRRAPVAFLDGVSSTPAHHLSPARQQRLERLSPPALTQCQQRALELGVFSRTMDPRACTPHQNARSTPPDLIAPRRQYICITGGPRPVATASLPP